MAGSGQYQPTAPEFAKVHTAALLQQIDLLSGDLRSERRGKPADGADEGITAIDAVLDLADTSFEPDDEEVDDLFRWLEALRSYVADRRIEFLCGPAAPRDESFAECVKGGTGATADGRQPSNPEQQKSN
jgi:hypothetical protein